MRIATGQKDMESRPGGSVRVGLYVRVSTEGQAADGVSLEEQEARLRAGVSRHAGWHVVDAYVDDGYSGHDMNRPEVRRCLKDVAAGRLDVVLALDIDRAHRNEQTAATSSSISSTKASTWRTSSSLSLTARPCAICLAVCVG